jgi:hypothetical protein
LWSNGHEFGRKLDSVFSVPELVQSEWSKRVAAIRILFHSLWSMTFGESFGGPERTLVNPATRPAKGYFQLGMDSNFFVMRLICPTLKKTHRQLLSSLWPDSEDIFSCSQLLIKYADFVRVHAIAESSSLEITVALMKSAPSQISRGLFQTHWIEPVTEKIFSELPFELPNARSPYLKKLPSTRDALAVAPAAPAPPAPPILGETGNRLVVQAANKIKELTQLLVSRDELIKELRMGGVGTAPPLAPPDAGALLEAFQQKYFETRYQIRQFELQIGDLEKRAESPREIEILRLKIAQLHAQETAWIKKLAATIEMYRQAKKKA